MIWARLLSILFLFYQCGLYSQSFTSRRFTTDNGLPDLYVYYSFQDNEGYLWSATTKGLVRFDGQSFSNFSPRLDEGDFIYSGAVDSKGELWFGSFAGKLFTYKPGTDSLSVFPGQIAGSVDRIIASSDKKNVYLISKGSGIYILNNSKIKQMPFSQIYQVNGAVEMEPGLVLLATPEGLYTADIKTQTVKKVKGCDLDVSQIQKLKAKNKIAILQNGTSLTAGTLNASLDSIVLEPVNDTWQLSSRGINRFYFDEMINLVYVITSDESFNVIDPASNQMTTFDQARYQATANSLFTDKDHNIWISTAGKGLYRLFKEEYGFISLNDAAVYSITRDANNTYFGTDNGIEIISLAGKRLNKIQKVGNTTLGKITAIYADGQKIWVGTQSNGLFIIDPNTYEATKPEFGMVKNITVNSITGNKRANEVYVGTNLDGAFIYENYKLKNHFSVQNSLLHNNVYYAIGCANKHIYYATHNTAINFSKNDQVFEIDIGQGLISDFNTFAESKEGNLAIGTNGDGVYFLKDTLISTMAKNNALESKFCNSLTYDVNDNLWLATRYSLYKYYPKQDVLKKIEFGNDNSILFNQNSFYADANGELLFGTNKNVLILKELNQYGSLPKASILKVKLFDSLIPKTQTFFKNGKYDISFEFSALCLRNSEEIRFRYILEGRDNKWSELTASRTVDYFALNEGNYVFKVKAYSGDGFSSEEFASFAFTIDKPVWKKAWFWVTVFILLIAIVYLIVRVRTSTLLKAKIRLEILVDKKTEELRHEKELVEAKNEIIEEQNQDITSSITYAKRIQEALLPDKNLDEKIKNKILIYYKPKDIVSGDFYWIAEKAGRFIFAACDCTGHGVPGAFMSMIGTTLFNKIVFDNNESHSDRIISEMDREISKSLHQENSEVNDGMEAALCSIDFETGEIEFTGAKRPLYLFRKQTEGYRLEEYKADKYPIGGFTEIKDKTFTLNKIKATEGDMLYMFSDGLIDQFSESDRGRIGSKRVRELLTTIAGLTISGQLSAVDKYISEWKGSRAQTDDILILGIRF